MPAPQRPIAYVLAATNHGSMIVNRNDHSADNRGQQYGVGFQLLEQASFDPTEVGLVLDLLTLRRQAFGDGVVAIDGGANIGVHALEWARHMHGWGRVLAFEAQEYVFYALAGNIALNNCWNANARWAALGEREGVMDVPEPDYLRAGSFGSLELRRSGSTEFIGQEVSYDAEDCVRTRVQHIDGLALDRLDFLKLDVEGMEPDVLRGAQATLQRHKPMVLLETLKSDAKALEVLLQGHGYRTVINDAGINMLAIHASDPNVRQITGTP